jgi:beta-glucosidase
VTVDGEAVSVAVPVENTSRRASREVVQVYVQPVEPDQPVRLVGWAGCRIDPGETQTVVVECDARLLRRWDTARGKWRRLQGGGTLLVARGLGDVRASVPLEPAATPASGAAVSR